MPGFLVASVLVFRLGWREDNETHPPFKDPPGRNDVPDVLRDDISGQKIELTAIVGTPSRVRVHTANVAAGGIPIPGGFDLNPQKASASFDHDVLAGGISPSFGNSQAMSCGFCHELQFGPFADLFSILGSWNVNHETPNKKRGPSGRVPVTRSYCYYINLQWPTMTQ